jgi:hypothetical protein
MAIAFEVIGTYRVHKPKHRCISVLDRYAVDIGRRLTHVDQIYDVCIVWASLGKEFATRESFITHCILSLRDPLATKGGRVGITEPRGAIKHLGVIFSENRDDDRKKDL